jgi:hypothetical protein
VAQVYGPAMDLCDHGNEELDRMKKSGFCLLANSLSVYKKGLYCLELIIVSFFFWRHAVYEPFSQEDFAYVKIVGRYLKTPLPFL